MDTIKEEREIVQESNKDVNKDCHSGGEEEGVEKEILGYSRSNKI